MSEEELACLLCHKCTDHIHSLGERIRNSLAAHDIRLLIDECGPGTAFNTGMETFEFDALLFMFTDEAWASAACQLEVQSACFRKAPMFTTQISGTLPKELKARILWTPDFSTEEAFQRDIHTLALEMRTRVLITRHLRLLNPENPPDVTCDAAKSLADAGARNVIAEFIQELAGLFTRIPDPNTQFWITQVLGSAGTEEAARLLRALPGDLHPYVKEGIREALILIEGDSSGQHSRKELKDD